MAEPDLDALALLDDDGTVELSASIFRALIAKARRAEALEELVRLLDKTGGKCGAERMLHDGTVESCKCNRNHGTDPDGFPSHVATTVFGWPMEWFDGDPNTTPTPWTPDALALLAALTSDGEVDRG